MKKTILKFIFSTCFIVLLFSSCLESGENSFQSGRDFAYITESSSSNYVRYAATANGVAITSEEIRNLGLGECYFLSYKVTASGGTTGGVNNAQDVVNLSNYPIPQTSLQQSAPVNTENSISVKTLDPSITYLPTDFLGDRWLFAYTVLLKEDEKVAANFYYDANNQKDKDGKDLKGQNAIVIDVRFVKTTVKPENTVEKENGLYGVGNLSALRTISGLIDFTKVEASSDGNKYVSAPILFRYLKYESAEKPAVETYLGTTTVNNGAYIMLFSNNR